MSHISDTDAIFARAYASALKDQFQIDVGKNNCILTSPVTLRGMATGDLIFPQMTNYLIYKCADSLQYSDNPSYISGSAGSYVQQLRSYIDWGGDPFFGPDANIFLKCADNLASAQSPYRFPCYNMDGLVDDQDLIENANSGVKIPGPRIEQSIIRVPAYSIPFYTDEVQYWITAGGKGATRDHVITIDTNQGLTTEWKDYGFKEVHGGGPGFWPFFSAEVYVNGKWESRKLDTEARENDISLELAMIGNAKFDIQPGQWDVPNVKELFPNRRPDGPDVLSSKFSRIVSVLVGYDVELKVKFGSNLRDEVNQIYEEVKTTNGRMSIFGFRVSAQEAGNSPDRVETKFSDVKWDHALGFMTLTPTKGQVYPTILGVVAQRFE